MGVVSLCLCLFVALLTLSWAIMALLQEPASLPVVNVCRILFSSGAVPCSMLAVVLVVAPELNKAAKDVVVIAVLLVFDFALPGFVIVKGVPQFFFLRESSSGHKSEL